MNLKELRQKKGITKISIANKLKVNRSTYDKIELGKTSLKAEHIPILSNIFGVTEKKILEIYMEDLK